MGKASPTSRNTRNVYSWADALSTKLGKHSIRFTGEYDRYQVNTFWPQYPAGSYRFSAGLTSLPGIINTGSEFASFVLGLADFGERSIIVSPSYFRRGYLALGVADQYEIRKGLSISVRLTFARNSNRREKFDRQSTVDLNTVNPANGRPGALIAAGQNGVGSSFRPALVRPEPKIGIAWNPSGDTRTVVRAAFARSYTGIPMYFGQWGTQGFNEYPTFISPNVQLEPAVVLARGLPAPSTPLPDLRADAANDTVADLIDRSDRVPTYQSASLSIERELPASAVLSLGASYSGGRNLMVGNENVNVDAISPDALIYRDRLNDEAFNRSLRPYPQYKGLNVYWTYPGGRYQRDVGFIRLEKRASKGLTVSAYYEFSKQMDDYSGPFGRQDFFNRNNEWAITAASEPQRVQFSYVYEFPLGSNKPFLSVQDWRRYLVDGWSVSGLANIASGSPLALQPMFNNTGAVVGYLNVNVVPGIDPHISNPSPDLWFNPAAFDQPPDFTLGNASRTHPSLRNPMTQNYDITLSKRIALAADRSLEFSAAGFNFINHANWNEPDTVIGPASAPNVNAGKIIGSKGGRVIQLGLRLSF
jgi:hypothetical protein